MWILEIVCLIADEIGIFLLPGVFWLLGIVFSKKGAGWVLWGIGDALLLYTMLWLYNKVKIQAYYEQFSFPTQVSIGVFLAVLTLILIILRRKKAAKTIVEEQPENESE